MQQQIDEDVGQSIRTYLAETCFVDMGQIGDDTSFMGAGVLDSIGFLEMVVFLERTFRIDIEDDEMIPENMDSIRNIFMFLERKRKA